MLANLAPAIDQILKSEGGFVNHPRDPGGRTNLGVTQATLAAWRGVAASETDVRALQRPEAAAIYEQNYADKVMFAHLPAGLDYALLDCAINSGVSRAVKLLQKVVGTKEDGVLGAITLAALDGIDPAALIGRYSDTRLSFLKTLKTWNEFGRGWETRVARVEDDALRMADGSAATQRDTLPIEGRAKGTGAVKLTSTASGQSALATAGAVLASAGVAATQASGVLGPYSDIAVVRWALLALAVISALGTVAVTLQRANEGVKV